MKKYGSIEQFRTVVKAVKSRHDYQGKNENGDNIYNHLTPYPKLEFRGTVKVHGTNSSIVKYKNGTTEFQSRERVLSLEHDNAQFMISMKGKSLDFLFKNIEFNDYIAIYGEWSGGNIQKGVAINGLPKMFVIFGIKVDDNYIHLNESLHDNSQGIYNILQFPTFDVAIDFNEPELIQNELIELTMQVEKECPVGAYFGQKGIGEGIVFTCKTDNVIRFKSKGELHSVSKVKTLNSVDVESIENIRDFVESVVTENRLNQGISYLNEMQYPLTPKSIGDFIRWIVKDVIKEEEDTILKNQLDLKKANVAISNKARVWFLNNF